MLDLKFIRENLELVRTGVKAKGFEADLDRLMALDADHRKLLAETERLKAERNKANDAVSAKKSKKQDFSAEIDAMKTLSHKIGEIDSKVVDTQSVMQSIMIHIPNIPDKSVQIGSSPTQNKVIKEVGVPKRYAFKPKDHIRSEERRVGKEC
jgi:seryl-tRNA synthetase